MGQDPMEKAERFQRLFVIPVVDAVRAEVREHLAPIVKAQQDADAKLAAQEARIGALEGSHKKALIGYGVYSSAAAIAIGAGWGWIKGKLRLS